jgi:hypothetical protein
MTKLYNFKALSSWEGPCLERMLGGTPVFKQGFAASLRLNLHEQIPWEQSFYRCLHTCFLQRSSLDPAGGKDRPNPVELSGRNLWDKMGMGFLRTLARGKKTSWKKEKYLRGDLVTLDVSPFFSKVA